MPGGLGAGRGGRGSGWTVLGGGLGMWRLLAGLRSEGKGTVWSVCIDGFVKNEFVRNDRSVGFGFELGIVVW